MPGGSDIRSAADRVAIIGAGLSGLVCARRLAEAGISVQVIEKARGPGGRMSTRRADEWRFDHGAQYFTARDPQFSQRVDSWRHLGLVERWAARIAVLDHGSIEVKGDSTERYVGVPGMNAVCRHLAAGLDITYGTEVAGLEKSAAGWCLTDRSGADIGLFDTVVVSAPAPQSARLLEHGAPEIATQAHAAEMAPCWAAMVGFARPLKVAFDGAFVVGSPLSWVARNASKPGRPSGESWILHASPEWSQRHLEIERKHAADLLLESFNRALGQPVDLPVHLAAHRWRFALPTEPLAHACLAHPELRVVACGDWCGGPRVEGAFLSGHAAARLVAQFGLRPRQRLSGNLKGAD
ncbi:MAG: FAD-dependent oxidoreductase [Acidobacteriota bacterium]